MLEPEDTAGCSWQKSRQTGTTLAYVYISTQSSVAKVSGKGFHGHLGKYWNALNSRSLEFCWVTAQRPRLAPRGRVPRPALQPWPRAPWRPAPSLRLPAPGRQRPWGSLRGGCTPYTENPSFETVSGTARFVRNALSIWFYSKAACLCLLCMRSTQWRGTDP